MLLLILWGCTVTQPHLQFLLLLHGDSFSFKILLTLSYLLLKPRIATDTWEVSHVCITTKWVMRLLSLNLLARIKENAIVIWIGGWYIVWNLLLCKEILSKLVGISQLAVAILIQIKLASFRTVKLLTSSDSWFLRRQFVGYVSLVGLWILLFKTNW
jgi:hypothetical protein